MGQDEAMKNAPSNEPVHEHDEDIEANPGAGDADEEHQPSIVAGVGSSALGSADIEPQAERHPDNDGETVEDS